MNSCRVAAIAGNRYACSSTSGDGRTSRAGVTGDGSGSKQGKTRQRELQDAIGLLGPERLAGVILNKYRGGMISEGYGVDSYYAAGYGTDEDDGAA